MKLGLLKARVALRLRDARRRLRPLSEALTLLPSRARLLLAAILDTLRASASTVGARLALTALALGLLTALGTPAGGRLLALGEAHAKGTPAPPPSAEPAKPAPAPSATAPPAPAEAAGATAQGPTTPGPRSARATPEDPVFLNEADAAELRRLPGIGAKRAEAILALRARKQRFTRVEELLVVKGIGQKTLAKLRPLLRLNRAEPPKKPQ